METKIGQKLVNSWSIVKATYCNKTIISSKLLNAKCYFNYVINIILQLATYSYVCSFYTWLCSPQACNNNNNNNCVIYRGENDINICHLAGCSEDVAFARH